MPCWTKIGIAFENSADPTKMASEEAILSGSTLYVIQFVNLDEQTTQSYLIGWQSGMGVANLIYSTRKGLKHMKQYKVLPCSAMSSSQSY